MNEFSNSATRISALIKKAKALNPQSATSVIWAQVFGLDENVAQSDPHELQTHLKLVREEIDLLERQMSETKFSKCLYEVYLQNVRSMVSVSNLGAQWASYNHYAGNDTLLALDFCAEIIETEELVNLEELQQILDLVRDLRTEIGSSNISSSHRSFLLHQLEIIERGIKDYPIKGTASLKKAFKDGITESISVLDLNEEAEAEEPKSRLGKIWKGVVDVGQFSEDAAKTISRLTSLASTGSNVFNTIVATLPN